MRKSGEVKGKELQVVGDEEGDGEGGDDGDVAGFRGREFARR